MQGVNSLQKWNKNERGMTPAALLKTWPDQGSPEDRKRWGERVQGWAEWDVTPAEKAWTVQGCPEDRGTDEDEQMKVRQLKEKQHDATKSFSATL